MVAGLFLVHSLILLGLFYVFCGLLGAVGDNQQSKSDIHVTELFVSLLTPQFFFYSGAFLCINFLYLLSGGG